MSDFWTPERIEALHIEIGHGRLTLAGIARKWGVTRNVVIGYANRHGIRPVYRPRSAEAAAYAGLAAQIDRACRRLATLGEIEAAGATRRCADPQCRNTRQPGRGKCAEHLRPPARARGWTGLPGGPGASSLG